VECPNLPLRAWIAGFGFKPRSDLGVGSNRFLLGSLVATASGPAHKREARQLQRSVKRHEFERYEARAIKTGRACV
jgi:hypothetical protein